MLALDKNFLSTRFCLSNKPVVLETSKMILRKIILLLFASEFNVFAYEVTEEQVTFYLRTRNNSEEVQLTPSNLNVLDTSRPFHFLIHGYQSSHLTEWYNYTTLAYLNTEDCNIILVDWKEPANLDKNVTADLLPQIAKYIVAFIQHLTNSSVSLANIHLVGHSLGAHTAGFVGKQIQTTFKRKLLLITALDPSNFKFENVSNPSEKLHFTDAHLLVVIHSDGGGRGLTTKVGHIDFFPNGGVPIQPGCEDQKETCSHLRSAEIFAESLLNPKGFVSRQCSSFEDFKKGLCDDNAALSIGEMLFVCQEGNYYLWTNAESPYSKE